MHEGTAVPEVKVIDSLPIPFFLSILRLVISDPDDRCSVTNKLKGENVVDKASSVKTITSSLKDMHTKPRVLAQSFVITLSTYLSTVSMEITSVESPFKVAIIPRKLEKKSVRHVCIRAVVLKMVGSGNPIPTASDTYLFLSIVTR